MTPASRMLRQLSVVDFFAALFVILLWVTRVQLIPPHHLFRASPHVVSGDEPHYLMVINSILFFHTLQLQNEYQWVRRGGLEAGYFYRGAQLDHHTIVVNRRTGHHENYLALRWPWPLEFWPSPEVYEVSSHPVGFPALLAAMIAPFRPTLFDTERYASVAMVFITWLGVVGAYLLARRAGLHRGWAIFAATLLAAASPWLPYTRSYYSEPAIGVSLVLALLAFDSRRPVLTGIAGGAMTVFKPPFAISAASLVLEALLERRRREAAKIAGTLAIVGIALMGFNFWLARTPIISGAAPFNGPFGWEMAHDLSPIFETMLGVQYGLLPFVPWTVVPLAAMVYAVAWPGVNWPWLRRLGLPCLAYLVLLAITVQAPGTCYGPRYCVPLLPLLAVAMAVCMSQTSAGVRLRVAVLIVPAAVIAILGALRYQYLFEMPVYFAWHGLS